MPWRCLPCHVTVPSLCCFEPVAFPNGLQAWVPAFANGLQHRLLAHLRHVGLFRNYRRREGAAEEGCGFLNESEEDVSSSSPGQDSYAHVMPQGIVHLFHMHKTPASKLKQAPNGRQQSKKSRIKNPLLWVTSRNNHIRNRKSQNLSRHYGSYHSYKS